MLGAVATMAPTFKSRVPRRVDAEPAARLLTSTLDANVSAPAWQVCSIQLMLVHLVGGRRAEE